MKVVPTLLASAILLPLSLSGAVPDWIEPRWSKSELLQLARGQSLVFHPSSPPSQGAHLGGAIWIRASRPQVWKVISDPASHPEYLKSVRESEILHESRNQQLIRHQVKLGILPMRFNYRYRADQRPAEAIDFKMVDGDLRQFQGRWRLLDAARLGFSEGTIVFYQLHLDPGSIVPQGILEKNLRKDLPQMLKLLRQRVGLLAAR